MQIGTDTTDSGGMRLTVTYGPTLFSVIFDPDDEDMIMRCIRQGFADARIIKESGHVYQH